MRLFIALLNFAFFGFGAWYVIRYSNREHASARKDNDPQLRRSVRWYDAGMITVVCGFLLMLGWIVTQGGSPSLHTALFILGIAAIAVGFALAGFSGWIKGGALRDPRSRDSEHR